MTGSSQGVCAGVAEAIITPAISGPLMFRPSTGVHDDLYARALVIDKDNQRIVIVCMDLVGLDFAFASELREQIKQRVGASMVLLNFSHTHSAPFTIPYTVSNSDWFRNGEGCMWRDTIRSRVLDIVSQASTRMVDVVLRTGRAPLNIAVNRRTELPGNAIASAETSDIVPWVDVLRVDRVGGSPLAVLFNYAAHPLAVHRASDLLSADFPGAAVRNIRGYFGEDTVAMFAQGCAGDINCETVSRGFEAAETTGQLLGEAAIRAALASTPIEASQVKLVTRRFDLPLLDPPSAEACEAYKHVMEARLKLPDAGSAAEIEERWWTIDKIRCMKDLIDRITRGERWSMPFEINAIQIGLQWCLLTMPHEMFSEYQRWIDCTSPFARTMVWAYTNASDGYIPTELGLEIGGAEAAPFPAESAVLIFSQRIGLKPGVEALIKDNISAVLNDCRSN